MPEVTMRETSPPDWVSISSMLRSRRMGRSHRFPVSVGHDHELADVGLAQEGALGLVQLREPERAVQQRADPPGLDVAHQPTEGGARALGGAVQLEMLEVHGAQVQLHHGPADRAGGGVAALRAQDPDRKSTRLNSSHVSISYAVFCLKKKK